MDLEHIVEIDDNPKMCAAAYAFRRSRSMEQLSNKINDTSDPAIWTAIRHYIGRLGSWNKASKFVLKYCRRFPDYISNFSVEHLPSPKPLSTPEIFQELDLRSVLEEVLPSFKIDLIELRLQECRDSQGQSIADKFAEYVGRPKFRPRVHCELVLLEHFHSQSLDFWGPDRYIGCSKPSCYCCNLYIEHHPGTYVRRPCHGNVWPKWSPPMTKKQFELSNLTLPILRNMLKSITKDLERRLLSDISWRKKVLDSVTAMSSSARISLLSY